jgi:hypothetical protein
MTNEPPQLPAPLIASIDSELRFEYATVASLISGLGALRMRPALRERDPLLLI